MLYQGKRVIIKVRYFNILSGNISAIYNKIAGREFDFILLVIFQSFYSCIIRALYRYFPGYSTIACYGKIGYNRRTIKETDYFLKPSLKYILSVAQNVSRVFVVPAKKQLWASSLCHSLVRHTNVDL